jgi:integrase
MTIETKPRRPKGSGTVRNRGTDRRPRWFAQYTARIGGERRTITRGPFQKKGEAELWLRGELERARSGRPIEPTTKTVAEFLDGWLANVRPRLEPSTIRNYESIIATRLVPHIGAIKIRDLGPADIARCYDALRQPGANRRGLDRAKPLSETSIQRSHAVLRTALAWAVRSRLIASNPADDVDRPRRNRTVMLVWTADELAGFLRHVNDDRLAPLWRLAAHTGMRRGELLGLRWDAVDLDRATLSVHRRRTKVGYEMVEGVGGKTDAASRTIDLDEGTVASLRAWRRHQLEDRLAWGGAWTDTGHVFTREDGQPLHADYVAQRFERLVRASGQPRIRFHDLRHVHATLMLKAGVPVKVVSERLGHASAAFTMNTYQHILPNMQAEAAARFADLVAGSHHEP